MDKKIQCNIVKDLLPLYMDELTSEETNLWIRTHLEECSDCQKDYQMLKASLTTSDSVKNEKKLLEINYLKKINTYQKINFILGAIISFLFGACIPVLRVGIPVLLSGTIPDYYLARLQFTWQIGLLKMAVSGVVVCLIYTLTTSWIKKLIINQAR